ncbi:lytic transglycosylase domain-containing protein [uncultured Photobacterium sp.]|uniref:lytic transglycosylase domain-containing protein n=1 Tax=uncultured Photobacterium sp. TaxID=173973 RepID=UPI0026247A87|nr:lytic transglycosylase domain-containing protein [uncultured Photobacterium sp.]
MFLDTPVEKLPTEPISHYERCTAVDKAAKAKGVPRDYLNLLVVSEGGKKGTAVLNKNKSWDLGPAQINTIHAKFIEKNYPGKTWRDVAYDTQLNINISADIFKQCLRHHTVDSNIWEAIGCYNSKTIKYKTNYLLRTMRVWDFIRKNSDRNCSTYWG